MHPRFPDSLYCCDDHDPACNRSTDPKIFRDPELRQRVGSAVAEQRNHRDDYTGSPLSANWAHIELDHVIEIQCARDCYDIVLRRHSEDQGHMQNAIRSAINTEKNLNFTTKEINSLKYEAIASFLEAYKENSHHGSSPAGISSFLLEAYSKKYHGKKLSRTQTSNIKREIVKSYEECDSMFEQENKSIALFCDVLHDMVIVGMRLK